MRIAIVSQARDNLVPPRLGSVALCSRHLSAALQGDHDVRIYGANLRGGTDRTFVEAGVAHVLFGPDRLDRLSLRLFRKSGRIHPMLNRGYEIPVWASRFLAPRYRSRVAAHLAAHPVDAVLVQHAATPVPAIRRALPDVPIILQLHAPIYAPALSRAYLRAIGRADAVSGVSRFIAADTAQKIGRETHVIRNGVDAASIAGRDRPLTDRKRSIVFVGAVSPEKGVHHLIDAFNEVCRTHNDVSLEIIGTVAARTFSDVFPQNDDPLLRATAPMFRTDYGAALRARLSPEARGRCRFRGWMAWDDLVAEVGRARVLALPSVCEEGFGLPPLEAMAAGTVPVVSDRGALPEVIEDGVSGLVTPAGDAAALARSMRRLLDDDQLWGRLSEAGRRRAETEFSWFGAADDLVRVVDMVRTGRRAK